MQQSTCNQKQSRVENSLPCSMFWPNKTYLVLEIKQGLFKTWHNLKVRKVKVCLMELISKQLEHMKQTRQFKVIIKSLQSTKCTNMVFVVTHDTKSKIYTDLAWRFQILLRYGNIYIFIV